MSKTTVVRPLSAGKNMYKSLAQVKKLPRNQYGDIECNFAAAIAVAYPEIEVKRSEPGCWGHNAEIDLEDKVLTLPSGSYSSNKHLHTAGHSLIEVEDARQCKLNLAGNPLYLISGRAYNGDYRSLKKTYFLFSRNEDGSFFCHKIRPSAAAGGLDSVRNWVWRIEEGEKILARQGDLEFIKTAKLGGKPQSVSCVQLGNHTVRALAIQQTKYKIWALNPIASHGEHDRVQVVGWCELRLGRAWSPVGRSD
jgi:hypothetical protein